MFFFYFYFFRCVNHFCVISFGLLHFHNSSSTYHFKHLWPSLYHAPKLAEKWTNIKSLAASNLEALLVITRVKTFWVERLTGKGHGDTKISRAHQNNTEHEGVQKIQRKSSQDMFGTKVIMDIQPGICLELTWCTDRGTDIATLRALLFTELMRLRTWQAAWLCGPLLFNPIYLLRQVQQIMECFHTVKSLNVCLEYWCSDPYCSSIFAHEIYFIGWLLASWLLESFIHLCGNQIIFWVECCFILILI